MNATECQIKITTLEQQLDEIYYEIDTYINKYGSETDPVKVNNIHRPHIQKLHSEWLKANNDKIKFEKCLKVLLINKEDNQDVIDWQKVYSECGKHIHEDDGDDDTVLMDKDYDI